MNLKKIISLLIVFIIGIFTLASCDNKNELKVDWTKLTYEQKVEVPNGLLLKEGTLIVTTSPDYSPYEFKDIKQEGDKQYQGADIFLANYLAQTMGLKLKILESSFDGLVTQLNTNKADIILAGLTYTEAREQNYTFTDVYYDSGDGGQVVVTLKENLDKYNSFEALNNSDVKIGCQKASVQEELVTSQLPNATPYPVGKIEDGIQLLNKGTVDVIALSQVNAETLANTNSDIVIINGFVFEDSIYQGTRGLLTKNNPLADYVNEAISYLGENTYQEWLDINVEYVATLSAGDMAQSNFFVRFWNILTDYALQFLQGTGITLALSAVTVIFGTIIAILLQTIRSSRFLLLRSIGNVYVEFVRGIPLLLLLWLLYMLAPGSWPTFISVGIALFLNSGAYVAEIIRAGILAVDKGQYEAARTLGLSKFQTAKKIILPQATKKILPALGNEFVALIKETSLASVFFIGDLMTIKNNITSLTYLSIEPFIIVGVIYFVLTFGTTKLIKHFELKMEA